MKNSDGEQIKCLNDNLICRINISGLNSDCYGTYKVYNYLHKYDEYDSSPFFVGNIFIKSGTRRIDIDLNDIVETQKSSFDLLKIDEYEGSIEERAMLMDYLYTNFKVILTIDTTDDIIKEYERNLNVGLWSDYPTVELDSNNMLPYLPSDSTDKYTMLQGVDTLLPRYPFIHTDKYGFGFVGYYPADFDFSEDEEGKYDFLFLKNLDGDVKKLYFEDSGVNGTYIKLSTLLSGVTPSYDVKYNLQIKNFVKEDENLIVISEEYGVDNFYISPYGDATRIVGSKTLPIYYGTDNYKLYIVDDSELLASELEGDIESGVIAQYQLTGDAAIFEHDDWVGQKKIAQDLGVIDDWKQLISRAQINQLLNNIYYSRERAEELVTYYGEDKIEMIEAGGALMKQNPSMQTLLNGVLTDVLKFDYCSSDYYIQWFDRTYGVQSQPFEKVATMSEKFTDSTITNFRGYKRSNRKESALKWILNTDWINEKLYPYYESLFTSPYIVLYDVKNDKVFNVILKDTDYTEKTQANQQGKLFNLTITVENNKGQAIVY